MTDPGVDLEMLKRAAFYQQIFSELMTLFHLALLGGLGLLYMHWKARRNQKHLEEVLRPLATVTFCCLECNASMTVAKDNSDAILNASGWTSHCCARCYNKSRNTMSTD